MNWEKVLKQPELQQPPMEQPPMEEPMVDPTTGLPLDPMAQQAGMAVPPQTPTNPNPTGEEEFPVDPEVEDDAKLNKWFSTIVKQTRQTTLSEFQPPQPDPNKKKEQDRLLAQRNAQMQQALGQASANRGQQAQRAVGTDLTTPLIQQVDSATTAAANTATGRELRETGKGIKQGFKDEIQTLGGYLQQGKDAGKKIRNKLVPAIADPETAVFNVMDKTKNSWKDAVKRRNERVYGGYENPQQQKEAKEKERIAERQKKIAERLKVRQEQQASGASKPRQYTDPETGEVKDMERGYADTGIQEYDIGRSESSLGQGMEIFDEETPRQDDQEKFMQFKYASNQLGIDWKKYKSQAGYRNKMQNDLKNKYNITADDITRFQDKVGQASFSGKKVQPRLLTEEERVKAFKRQREGRSLSSSYLAGLEDEDEEKKMDLQKQDRRDDPALWESWDGGLVDY